MGKIAKIKMRDFKSFKNAVIPVVDGFTTVVGPNGCGKSNFLDALIFALGGASMKTIRAGRLTDLVNHNSKKGTAEVTVELRDGKDKHSITREIDKKGASVFRLNDKKTTRIEIIELLNSFSIPSEGHNLIMQGDVMSIVNMTPRQRREVIDDISGIAEYNQKKEKAMKELDSVDAKINEANIILYERKGYLGELKKERDEAIRYTRFDERKRDMKINIIHRELADVEERFNKTLEAVTEAKKEVTILDDSLKKINAQLQNWQNELDELNKEIMSKGESEQMELHKQIEELKGKITVLEERLKTKQDEVARAKNAISIAQRGQTALKKENAEKLESLEQLKKENAAYDERVKEKEKERDEFMNNLKEKNLLVGDVTQKLEEMNKEISERKEAFYKLQSTMAQIQEKVSIKKFSVTDESQEKKQTDERVELLKKNFEEMNREVASLRREYKGLEQEIEESFKNEKEQNSEMEKVEAWLEQSREKYHSLQSKVTTIKHMTGNMASDAVMKARSDIGGIVGKVEELCSFDEKHANAIQTAAGPRMQFIITEDSASATKAIKWLKKKKLGRTTFIPLDVIKTRDPSDGAQKALENNDALGLAIDLVKFDKKMLRAFQYVLGDTVIVRDIDAAKTIGFGKCRMATLDGDLAEASGAVSGGFKHGALTLQEIKSVDEMKAKTTELEKKKEKITAAIQKIRDDGNAVRGRKAEIELQLKEKEVTLREVESRLKEYGAITEKVTSKKEGIEKEIEGLKFEFIEAEKLAKEKQVEIKQLEEEKESVKEKMDSPEVKKVMESLSAIENSVQTVRDQKAEVVIQMNSLQSELEKLFAVRREQLDTTVAENEKLIAEVNKGCVEAGDALTIAKSELKDRLEEEKRVSSSIRGLIERRENLEKQIREMAEDRGMAARKKEVKQQHLNEANIEKAKLETKYSDLKSEYESNEKPSQMFDDMTVAHMKEEIDMLTQKMIRLEPINLKAVEVYEKYLSEVDNMKEKGKTLQEEKEAIIEMMKQIEERRVTVFLETFDGIRQHFSEIYKQFFPEAMDKTYADLKLENKDDPFEGGLFIEARPAGKPIKKIDQMSGGEKTLTAIAFVFAIQSHKPSPFYVLDEADAALDKANSQRLTEMLKKRSQLCQFIVITHNNPLIHASDQIIGISMDKNKGTSVVEVDLKSLEQKGQLTEEVVGTYKAPKPEEDAAPEEAASPEGEASA